MQTISSKNTQFYPSIIQDYLEGKLHSIANIAHGLNWAELQAKKEIKKASYTHRSILVEVLQKQYQDFPLVEEVKNNIDLLLNEEVFTITTGHQLNLFSGPLYFLYKIISTINLTKELKSKYPSYNFVPVYWMATEDHDFDEINYFTLKGKKIQWKKESQGPVGRLNTSGLEEVFEQFSTELGLGNNANYLRELFKKSYLEHENLADATRYLANELFKNEGLVILDGDDLELKKLFIPYAKEELLQQTSFKKVNETLPLLKEYNVQVNPREINLFYIQDDLRERIVFEDGNYKINNTQLSFSESEILTELENNPKNFSPNVILRPLYQEVILPNLCYIGGGGELAYWLELKSNFEANNITFPILLLRNSALVATKKQVEKLEKLELNWSDVFQNQQTLVNEKTKEFSNFTIDFSEQKAFLKNQFEALYTIANKTDKSFLGAVKAQEVKQLKGLENLEKKLLKAEKRIHTEKLERIIKLQNELFPNQSLQERKSNFADFHSETGNLEAFFSLLYADLQPLKQNFSLVVV